MILWWGERMEEDEKAIMVLFAIVGFVLLWIFLEELGYMEQLLYQG